MPRSYLPFLFERMEWKAKEIQKFAVLYSKLTLRDCQLSSWLLVLFIALGKQQNAPYTTNTTSGV